MTEPRFDNSMLTWFAQDCPFKYMLRYVHGLVPNKREMALEFGKTTHEMCDKMFGGASLEDAKKVFEAFEDNYDEDGVTLLDEKRTKQVGLILTQGYYEQYSNQPFDEVSFVEKYMEIDFPSFKYGGRIDKIIKWMFGTCPVDHKTTTSYLQDYFRDVDKKHQFTGYIDICRQSYEGVSSLLVDAIYVPKLLKTKPPRMEFDRKLTERSEFQIQLWRKWVVKTVENIQRAMESGYWQKFDNCCTSWNRLCPYKGLCDLEMSDEEIVAIGKESIDYRVEMWEPWREDK